MAIANILEYAKLFQTTLDKQIVVQSTSGWMELNANLLQYNGGNEVKVPKLTMDALGNYDRTLGFVDGSVTFAYETRSLTQDRGRTFSIDRMDVDETAFVPTASSIMGEFQRLKVIPEIDAYRYSRIAALAAANSRINATGYAPVAADILTMLKKDISDIQDIIGEVPFVITMAAKVAAILENSTELQKFLEVIDFTQGEINTKVKGIDGNPIIKVPSARMKTAYVFNDGKTAGQEGGGFAPAPGAKDINWIIMPRNAAIAVSKTDKIRIFEPDLNQKADAYKIDYRKYHDLWILDNQFPTIFVNKGA